MNVKSVLPCALLVTGCLISAAAPAQDVKGTPVDGQTVRLDAQKLWRFSYLPNIAIENPVKIADEMAFPSISPDGSRVVMFKKGRELEENSLHEWKSGEKQLREIARGEEVSNFVTWEDNGTVAMRERSKPNLRESVKIRYDVEPKMPALRDRRPIALDEFVAFSEGDIIFLESKKTQTLQAISDTGADRYYGPVISPDQRFVAFNGLTSGVHLFDVEANAVVFIGNHGVFPSFSADGRYLIYTDSRDDGSEITSGDFILIDLHERTYRAISNPNREIRLTATLSHGTTEISYMLADGSVWKASLPVMKKKAVMKTGK